VENDYIVTTPDVHDTHGLETVSWAELYAADFAFNKAFCLRLNDRQAFFGEQVVRIIPRRRMVVYGTWHGKPAVAKIFLDIRNPKLHMEKDIAGIRTLLANKIPTPELLHEGFTEDKKVYVLIFERIMDSRNLEEIWYERHNIEEVMPILKAVMIEIATQHVLGILQHDLHLKNFLLTEKTIYTLDGAQIELFPHLLSRQVSVNNLVLLLSQLGVDAEVEQERLFRYYAEARGWTIRQEDVVDFFVQIKKSNAVRWRKYEKKIFRNSTHFVRLRQFSVAGMYNRHYAGPQLLHFLSQPESAFVPPHAKLLKSGNSATVAKIRMDGRDYVVKRYNMKNLWHRLRRSFRETRACASWRLANKLNLFGITTATPVAFIENRFMGVRGVSYYVMEYVSGEHAGEYFTRNFNKPEKVLTMVRRISMLLKSVAKVEVTHGDLKITNILVNAAEQPVLIDLDGAHQHSSLSGLRKAWQKELQRFLENFNTNPGLQKKFESELAKW
jgi:tRNA A-37 threonylcarbamoyl transferase component Bud32